MRRTKRTVFSGWPSWRYGPNGESAVFQCADDVPEGWVRTPGGKPDPVREIKATLILDRVSLVEDLLRHNVEINPTWGVAHMKKVLDDTSSAR